MLARYGFWAGILALVAMQWLPAPQGMDMQAWQVASIAALMAVWWFTEAVPIPLTGSVPFMLLPVFGVQSGSEVSANYMAPVLFLVLGGSILGLATEKWDLHRRLALRLLQRARPSPTALVLALMLATAAVSMVVNNSATTIMMLPIAAAIIGALPESGDAADQALSRQFAAAMYLSIAIASNMGGFVTPVGTPVNPVIIELAFRQFGLEISFAQWMSFCLPLILLGLPIAWLLITRPLRQLQHRPLRREDIMAAVGTQGALTVPQKRTLAILAGTSALWIGLPWLGGWLPGVSAATVAMVAALALCSIPSGENGGAGRPRRLLEWKDCARAPWYLVFLLGGGLALADAILITGLSEWIGGRLQWLAELPLPLVLLIVALICIAVTECASQVGTATTFMPIVAAVALSGGLDPVPIALAAGLGASWGMANPAGTSSNAMVIATGKVPVTRFIGVGAVVDLLGVLLIGGTCLLLVPLLLP
jgi:sodium-dependent dicarboxylate transporter 2/3/5